MLAYHTYRNYTFEIIGNDGAKRWRVWTTPIDGLLINPLTGNQAHATTLAAYNAARTWIDGQVEATQYERDQAEFDRLFAAGRGTLRLERGDYVLIAHCHNTGERIPFWFVTIYHDSRFVIHAEFTARYTFDELDAFFRSIISINGGA